MWSHIMFVCSNQSPINERSVFAGFSYGFQTKSMHINIVCIQCHVVIKVWNTNIQVIGEHWTCNETCVNIFVFVGKLLPKPFTKMSLTRALFKRNIPAQSVLWAMCVSFHIRKKTTTEPTFHSKHKHKRVLKISDSYYFILYVRALRTASSHWISIRG